MENYQFWTLIGLLAAGFGFMIVWLRSIDKSVADIDKRVSIIEVILSMMGAPIKQKTKHQSDL